MKFQIQPSTVKNSVYVYSNIFLICFKLVSVSVMLFSNNSGYVEDITANVVHNLIEINELSFSNGINQTKDTMCIV